jgi:hypothetical protein
MKCFATNNKQDAAWCIVRQWDDFSFYLIHIETHPCTLLCVIQQDLIEKNYATIQKILFVCSFECHRVKQRSLRQQD